MPLPLIPLAVSLAAEFGPGLVKWIAGDDAGDTAQKVVDIVTGATGPSNDPLVAARNLPPEVRAQITLGLAKIEADKEAARRAAELEELKAEIGDRMDARARDIALVKAGAGNVRSNIMVGGAFVVLIVCVGVVLAYGLKNWALTGEAIAIVSTVATGALACLKDAFGFEFGSSRSSKDKDAVLAKIIQNGH